MKYLYNRGGDPVAVLEGRYVYGMNGYALGFSEGTHVYRLDGAYVGELYQDMVVNTYTSSPGNTSPPGDPGRMPPFDSPGGRGPVDYGYPDVIDGLFER